MKRREERREQEQMLDGFWYPCSSLCILTGACERGFNLGMGLVGGSIKLSGHATGQRQCEDGPSYLSSASLLQGHSSMRDRSE